MKKGHSRSVERLVGLGSNLNSQDIDGNTPLHTASKKKVADSITAETPKLKEVRLHSNYSIWGSVQ